MLSLIALLASGCAGRIIKLWSSLAPCLPPVLHRSLWGCFIHTFPTLTLFENERLSLFYFCMVGGGGGGGQNSVAGIADLKPVLRYVSTFLHLFPSEWVSHLFRNECRHRILCKVMELPFKLPPDWATGRGVNVLLLAPLSTLLRDEDKGMMGEWVHPLSTNFNTSTELQSNTETIVIVLLLGGYIIISSSSSSVSSCAILLVLWNK